MISELLIKQTINLSKFTNFMYFRIHPSNQNFYSSDHIFFFENLFVHILATARKHYIFHIFCQFNNFFMRINFFLASFFPLGFCLISIWWWWGIFRTASFLSGWGVIVEALAIELVSLAQCKQLFFICGERIINTVLF